MEGAVAYKESRYTNKRIQVGEWIASTRKTPRSYRGHCDSESGAGILFSWPQKDQQYLLRSSLVWEQELLVYKLAPSFSSIEVFNLLPLLSLERVATQSIHASYIVCLCFSPILRPAVVMVIASRNSDCYSRNHLGRLYLIRSISRRQ